MRKSLPTREDYDFIVLGAFRYPAGDASANRMLTLAQLAVAAGRRPLVLNDHPALATDPNDGVGTYAGIDYLCVGEGNRGRLYRLMSRLSRAHRLRRIVEVACATATQRVVMTVPPGLFNVGLHLEHQRALGITVVSDIVERHDPDQFPRGRLDPVFLRHRWTSWLAARLSDGCIVISTELERQLDTRRTVLRLPALGDPTEFAPPTPRGTSRPLTLLYAGNPLNKDQLGTLIDVLLEEGKGGRAVELRLAGPDATSLSQSADVGEDRARRFGTIIRPLGRLSRDRLKHELGFADFTVLFRPDRGYARAGFPSKVPESLAAGTPVICNLSSDLALYLADGENAVICRSDPSTGEVARADLSRRLEDLRSASDEDLFAMRLAAWRSANELSVPAWAPVFRDWLADL